MNKNSTTTSNNNNNKYKDKHLKLSPRKLASNSIHTSSSKSSMMDTVRSCVQMCFGKKIRFDDEGITVSITSKSIGEGSYSDVLKGIDTNTFKKYAIKKMIIQSNDSENNVKMEIESFTRFQHIHILKCLAHKYVLDHNNNNSSSNNSNNNRNTSPRDQKKIVYLLFPYIQRGNLREQLNLILSNKMKPLPFLYALQCMKNIAEALYVLHSYNPSYVHNDIKPENILIGDDGQPLLTDFGSVRLADIHITNRNDSLRVAEEAAQYCTLQYRPPELHDPPVDSTLDSRTDVWGIGCLFYAWWYGYSPYEINFDKNGHVAQSDCTYLRILSSTIPYPPNPTHQDTLLLNVLESILVKEMKNRPFTNTVILKMDYLIGQINGLNNTDSSNNGHGNSSINNNSNIDSNYSAV